MKPAADTAPTWWVICLCAQWCGVCREWRDAFMQTAASHPELRFAWVDVEDEADAMGDVDIETFPTVMIAGGDRPLFLGPVQPSGGQLARLIASLQQTAPGAGVVPGEAGPLLERLMVSVLPKP
jgi:hypothetical protein